MNNSQRMWKTGALAVAITIAFAIFVFKIEEWSGGFDSEFLVYGQSSGTGGTAGGTATAATVTKIIPQIVVGSYDNNLTKYITVIQVVNTGTASITVSGNFYNQNGTPSTLPMNISSTAQFTGTLNATTVAANNVLVITASTASAGTTNWGRIVTTGSAAVSAYFELRDNTTNVLYNRVGVASSSAEMTSFVVPRVRNVAAGLDVGFALVNTGTTAANLTGTLRDASGTAVAARTISLPAANHTAVFTREFFTASGCAPCLGTEPSGTNYSFVTFSSSSAQFAAMALAIEGGALSSFPVERLE